MGNFNVTITSLMYHMHHERFELSPPKRLRLECSALDRSANDADRSNMRDETQVRKKLTVIKGGHSKTRAASNFGQNRAERATSSGVTR